MTFSRVLRVAPLPRDGLTQDIEANAQERAALAELNGLAGVAALSAHFLVKKWRRGVRVEGALRARVTQTCVVSLEPFEVEIAAPIEVRFLPTEDGGVAPEVSADDDAPDELVDGKVDLGALASEFLTLSLDPYPRRPGVAFATPDEAAPPASPFDRLRALSDREEPD